MRRTKTEAEQAMRPFGRVSSTKIERLAEDRPKAADVVKFRLQRGAANPRTVDRYFISREKALIA